MAEAVSSVHVDISAETAKLQEGVRRAQGILRQFGKDAGRDGKAVGDAISGVVASVGGLAAAFVGVTSAFDAFNKHVENTTALDNLSQATGISVQRLAELQTVARIAGLEVTSLTQAATVFGARMTEAIGNPAGRTSLALRSLGIEVREADGSIKSFEKVLLEVAQQFPKYADGTNKAAIAAAIFGEEAGPRLVALLNRGRDGIEELQRTVRSAYRPEDVEAVRRYRQASAELGETVDRVLLPALTQVVTKLTAVINHANNAAVALSQISPSANAVTAQIGLLNKELDRHRERFQSGEITAERFAEVERRIKQRVEELRGSVQSLNQDMAGAGSWQTTTTPASKPQAPTIDTRGIKAAQGELALFMARLQQMPMTMEFVSTSYAAAWEKMRAVMVQSGETASAIEAARLNLLMQQEQARLQGLQSVGITMSIEEQYQDTIRRTDDLLRRGIITAQEAGRAHQIAGLTAANAWTGAMGQVAGALAQAFPKQKAFAVAAAIINVAEGITKALTLPFPLNWVQAAAVAASGLAQINAIKSANPSGSGGSVPSVGGGAGATATEPAAQAASQALTINLPAGRYTHEEVMQIIEGINERVQNGATLISTKVAA